MWRGSTTITTSTTTEIPEYESTSRYQHIQRYKIYIYMIYKIYMIYMYIILYHCCTPIVDHVYHYIPSCISLYPVYRYNDIVPPLYIMYIVTSHHVYHYIPYIDVMNDIVHPLYIMYIITSHVWRWRTSC